MPRKIGRYAGRCGTALAAALLLAIPGQAQAPELRMLDSLTKGGWTLRIRDDGTQRPLCVRDGREFLQLQHRDSGCSRFVVNDGAESVTVQYTCRGNGYGRTTVRRESNGLVQIQTQGIHDGTPFSYAAEGRHSGSC